MNNPSDEGFVSNLRPSELVELVTAAVNRALDERNGGPRRDLQARTVAEVAYDAQCSERTVLRALKMRELKGRRRSSRGPWLIELSDADEWIAGRAQGG